MPFGQRSLGLLGSVVIAGLGLVPSFAQAIVAGSLAGTPVDSLSARIDANIIGSMFSGVGALAIYTNRATGSGIFGTGTLIDSRHVLTAAHLFDKNNDGVSDTTLSSIDFVLNVGTDQSHILGVNQVTLHPNFMGLNALNINTFHDDFAILTLNAEAPATAKTFAPHSSAVATGTTIVLAGYGDSGNGDDGFTTASLAERLSVKRTGSNALDQFFTDDEGSGAMERYLFDFDGPSGNGSLGGPTLGNASETMIGAGDSGSPAFIAVNGEYEIAGINSYALLLPLPKGSFGATGGGNLIYDALPWINDLIAIPEPSMLTIALLAPLFIRRTRSR